MEKPIKILIIITDTDLGGTEKIVFELARALSQDIEKRFEVKVIALKRRARMAARLEDEGIAVQSLDLGEELGVCYLVRALAAIWDLRSILNSEKPDLVHGFLFQGNLFARMSKFFTNAKIFSSLRVIDQGWFKIKVDGWTSFLTDLYLCVSDQVKLWALPALAVPQRKIIVIKNGIDPEAFLRLTKDEARIKLGWPALATIITTIARLDRQKGVDLLIKSASLVLRERPDSIFLVVGDGPDKKALVELTRVIGVEKSFIFTGAITDIPTVLAASDIFALPSRWEGMPNVILEAMSGAKPIVAARIGGVPEMLEDRREALLVPPEDVNALARALLELMNNPELSQKIANQARKRVEKEFSLNEMIDNYKKLYLSFGKGKL